MATVEAVPPPHPARNKRLAILEITSVLISTTVLFMMASRLHALMAVALPLIRAASSAY